MDPARGTQATIFAGVPYRCAVMVMPLTALPAPTTDRLPQGLLAEPLTRTNKSCAKLPQDPYGRIVVPADGAA